MSSIPELLSLAYRNHQAGNFPQAELHYRQILQRNPQHVDALHMLGLLAHQTGRNDVAQELIGKAVRLKPTFAEAHSNLGNVLQQLGKLDDAIASWRRALRFKPQLPEVHSNLGSALMEQGKLDEAEASLQQALLLRPNFPDGHNNLGNVFKKQGKFAQAVASFRQAVQIKPDYVQAYVNLGATLHEQREFEQAVAVYHQALARDPNYAEGHSNLGLALRELGRFDQALTSLQRAVQLRPDNAEAHNNLGLICFTQGKLDEALAYYRQALRLKPDYAIAHSNLVFTMQYRPGITLAELAQAHDDFERQHAAPLRAGWRPHEVVRDPERKLRLGLVSADFGVHPIGFFLIGLLENLDRSQVDVVCYSNRPVPDAMTGRFRAASTEWREGVGLRDDELADRIRADRIDVLVDLAGHTARNRLLVFARKPAPIQLTWAGYVGTTGLAAIDYLVADPYYVPPEAEPHYRERILRLPDAYVCYEPPGYAPAVKQLPALNAGHVTFGSFNIPLKINPEVVRAWASILNRVPGSRLMLKYRGMSDPLVAGRLIERFAGEGIEAHRLDLLDNSPHEELLEHYNRIDIALDPFPYSGGLTTCEALWMGVPVVTCPGETFASRHSLSYLSVIGLTETICRSQSEYEDCAASLAGNLPRLAELRAGLRTRIANSPVCDRPRFARDFTVALRDAWRRYCAAV